MTPECTVGGPGDTSTHKAVALLANTLAPPAPAMHVLRLTRQGSISMPPKPRSHAAAAAARDEEGARALGMAPRSAGGRQGGSPVGKSAKGGGSKAGGGSSRGGSGTGGGGKSGKAGRSRGKGAGFLAGLRAWTRATLYSTLLGGTLGSAAVLAICYRGAVQQVETGLSGQVWTVPGHVWSAPIEVWSGLRTSPEDLARVLISAGYTRVENASRAGDVQVGDGTMLVYNRASQGFVPKPAAGKKTGDAGGVMITFRDGRIRSISPGSRVKFAPALLATMRGPDNENRNPVPLDRIPKVLQQAVLATEDARFYDHPGIDPVGLVRALAVDLWHQEMVQGGSSLTQQVVKNIFLTSERTASRKFSEVMLAFALERKLSKDQILELYLNEVYLGQGGGASLCGMDAAARAWFGKSVERVTLIEAATLAGTIASPNQWSPVKHPDAALGRRNTVLDRMVSTGFLTSDQATAAKAEPVVTSPAPAGRQAPYAVDRAVEQIEVTLGEGAIARQALDVRTSIQPLIQALAEQAVQDGYAEVAKAHPSIAGAQAAAVVLRASDGAVVAQVGGRDWEKSPFDRVSDAVREVGSTVKPLTLLFALEADPNLSPGLRLDDAPLSRTHDGKVWTPENYSHNFVGPISLRRAIAQSRNIPAVLLSERVGLQTERDRLRALGLKRATDYPSVALGGFGATPLELAAAYAIFAGDGRYHSPWVTGSAWQGEESVFKVEAHKGPFYTSRARWLATDVMRSVMREGTGTGAAKFGVGPGAAGKSGTTDAMKDAWFAGVSGEYSVVVWMGFDDGKPLGLTGSTAALPIWARLVSGLGNSASIPGPPDGIVSVDVCDATDLSPCLGCASTHREWFTAGAVPDGNCVIGKPGAVTGDEQPPGATGSATGDRPVDEKPAERGLFQSIGDVLGLER